MAAFCVQVIKQFAERVHIPWSLREELCGEVWLKLAKSADAFDAWENQAALAGWIKRMVTTKAADSMRSWKRERRRRVSGFDVELAVSPECPCPIEQAELLALVPELLAWLEARMPPGEYQVFALCDVQGVSLREAALTLHLASGHLRVRLCRARKRVRRLMQHRDDFLNSGKCPPPDNGTR